MAPWGLALSAGKVLQRDEGLLAMLRTTARDSSRVPRRRHSGSSSGIATPLSTSPLRSQGTVGDSWRDNPRPDGALSACKTLQHDEGLLAMLRHIHCIAHPYYVFGSLPLRLAPGAKLRDDGT